MQRPGSVTVLVVLPFLLSGCGSGGGSDTSSDLIEVPTDVRLISYPSYYDDPPRTGGLGRNPYCRLTSDSVAYPASYLGEFPLPPVEGAPLAANIRRGVAVKDYWANGLNNASTNRGCTGDLHTAFEHTLERLVRLGADHIGVFRDTYLEDATASSLRVHDWAPWAISDDEMRWIVEKAREYGLQVHEYRQLVSPDRRGNDMPESPTEAWAAELLDEYTEHIVERAEVAEELGVEAFQLDWGVYWWFDHEALYIQKMITAAQQVRNVYSGKILFGQTAPDIADSTLLNSIDWLIGDFSPQVDNAEENAALSVPLLKEKYLSRMELWAGTLGAARKPVVWTLFSQSHRDFLLINWIEDGFCTNDCEQESIQTDFSVQALYYEAMLEAIAEQTFFETASVDAKAYWFVDVILPQASFPNLSQSPRNKPAESILYEWFKQ